MSNHDSGVPDEANAARNIRLAESVFAAARNEPRADVPAADLTALRDLLQQPGRLSASPREAVAAPVVGRSIGADSGYWARAAVGAAAAILVCTILAMTLMLDTPDPPVDVPDGNPAGASPDPAVPLSPLEGLWQELQHETAAGTISEQDAIDLISAIKTKLGAVSAKLTAAVASGALTEAEAKAKYALLEREMVTNCRIDRALKAEWMTLDKRVRAGDLTISEAKALYLEFEMHLRQRMSPGANDRRGDDDDERDEHHQH